MYTINVYGSPYLARFSAGGQNDHDDHNPLFFAAFSSPMLTYMLTFIYQCDLRLVNA